MNERLPPPASASPVEPINTKTWIFEQMKKGGLPSARTDLARALHKRMQTEVKVGTLTKGVSFRHLVNLLSALGLGVVRPRR